MNRKLNERRQRKKKGIKWNKCCLIGNITTRLRFMAEMAKWLNKRFGFFFWIGSSFKHPRLKNPFRKKGKRVEKSKLRHLKHFRVFSKITTTHTTFRYLPLIVTDSQMIYWYRIEFPICCSFNFSTLDAPFRSACSILLPNNSDDVRSIMRMLSKKLFYFSFVN